MKFKTLAALDAIAFERQIPVNALFDITYRCNLRCLHCYARFPARGKELSFAEVISVLEQLAKAGGLYLDFSGGEPLIRKDFMAIARHARKLGFALTLVTNGTLITEEMADDIAELFPRRVKLSLYGPNESIYKRVTGKAHLFHQAIKGIQLLVERQVPVRINAQIFNFFTPEDVLGLKKICVDFGVDWNPSVIFLIKNNGDPAPLKYRLSQAQFEEFYKIVPEFLPSGKKRYPKEERVCKALRSHIHINAYGQVGCCHPLDSQMSIRQRPLLEIWRNDVTLKTLKELRWKDMSKCMECKSLPFCRPCPAANFLSTGSFTEIQAGFCEDAHKRRKISTRLKTAAKEERSEICNSFEIKEL